MQFISQDDTICHSMLETVSLSKYHEVPIPTLPSSAGWKEVPIHENGGELISLNSLDPNLIFVDPQYLKQGISHALAEMYLRKQAADALARAAKLLPHGLRIVVWDAWRPLEVQQSLFNSFKS